MAVSWGGAISILGFGPKHDMYVAFSHEKSSVPLMGLSASLAFFTGFACCCSTAVHNDKGAL